MSRGISCINRQSCLWIDYSASMTPRTQEHSSGQMLPTILECCMSGHKQADSTVCATKSCTDVPGVCSGKEAEPQLPHFEELDKLTACPAVSGQRAYDISRQAMQPVLDSIPPFDALTNFRSTLKPLFNEPACKGGPRTMNVRQPTSMQTPSKPEHTQDQTAVILPTDAPGSIAICPNVCPNIAAVGARHYDELFGTCLQQDVAIFVPSVAARTGGTSSDEMLFDTFFGGRSAVATSCHNRV